MAAELAAEREADHALNFSCVGGFATSGFDFKAFCIAAFGAASVAKPAFGDAFGEAAAGFADAGLVVGTAASVGTAAFVLPLIRCSVSSVSALNLSNIVIKSPASQSRFPPADSSRCCRRRIFLKRAAFVTGVLILFFFDAGIGTVRRRECPRCVFKFFFEARHYIVDFFLFDVVPIDVGARWVWRRRLFCI